MCSAIVSIMLLVSAMKINKETIFKPWPFTCHDNETQEDGWEAGKGNTSWSRGRELDGGC